MNNPKKLRNSRSSPMKRPPKLCRNKHRDFAYITVNGKQVYPGKWGSGETQASYVQRAGEIRLVVSSIFRKFILPLG